MPPFQADNIIPLERRQVRRKVAGLGELVFNEPVLSAEEDLAENYRRPFRTNYHRFANELIIACLRDSGLTTEQIEAQGEHARAQLRRGVVEALEVGEEWRKLYRTHLSPDERLFAVARHRHHGQLQQLAATIADVVKPMRATSAQTARLPGALGRVLHRPPILAAVEQNRRTVEAALLPFRTHERLTQQVARVVQPPWLRQLRRDGEWVRKGLRGPPLQVIGRLGEQLRKLTRPPWIAAVEQNRRTVEAALLPFRTHERLTQQVARVVQPPWLRQLRRDLTRPPWIEVLDRNRRQMEALRPQRFAEQLARLVRPRIVRGFEALDAYVEHHWVEVYVENPDHPPPVMFLIADFSRTIGLPLLEAARKRDDGLLLTALEAVVTDSDLIATAQAELQVAPHLDPVSRRHLVQALAWVGEQHYVDASPPLYTGLQGAFTRVARDLGIIDESNAFLVPARRRKAEKTDDLFEHLRLTPSYRRFLNAWVFRDAGNPYRHGDVPDIDSHRRQVLLAVVAVLGWLEHFANSSLMEVLSDRLESKVSGSSQVRHLRPSSQG